MAAEQLRAKGPGKARLGAGAAAAPTRPIDGDGADGDVARVQSKLRSAVCPHCHSVIHVAAEHLGVKVNVQLCACGGQGMESGSRHGRRLVPQRGDC
jgi:hypothetical protein